MKKKNKNINCDVTDCNHNDKENAKCNLDEVNITSNSEEETNKDQTVCDSFENIDNNIEEEYELGKEYYEESDE